MLWCLHVVSTSEVFVAVRAAFSVLTLSLLSFCDSHVALTTVPMQQWHSITNTMLLSMVRVYAHSVCACVCACVCMHALVTDCMYACMHACMCHVDHTNDTVHVSVKLCINAYSIILP